VRPVDLWRLRRAGLAKKDEAFLLSCLSDADTRRLVSSCITLSDQATICELIGARGEVIWWTSVRESIRARNFPMCRYILNFADELGVDPNNPLFELGHVLLTYTCRESKENIRALIDIARDYNIHSGISKAVEENYFLAIHLFRKGYTCVGTLPNDFLFWLLKNKTILSSECESIVKCYKEVLDFEAYDQNGFTPLTYSLVKGRRNMVYVLLRCGADPHLRDGRGKYPTQYACPSSEIGCLLTNEMLTRLHAIF